MYVVTFSSLLILMAEDLDGYEGDEDRIQGMSIALLFHIYIID